MTVTLLGAAALLDRQSGRRSDSAYLAHLAASPKARFMLVSGLEPVVRAGPGDGPSPTSVWFSQADLDRAGIGSANAIFLGVGDGATPHFAVLVDTAALTGLQTEPLSDLRKLASTGALAASDIALAGLARSLFAWHATSRYCGCCGKPTIFVDGGWKRRCVPCGHETFPRLDPVVIMLVTDGTHCVLAHEPRYASGMYSAIAGFIEPGEDIAHAVRRETFEELGLEVADVSVVQSQPWPFPHSLMIGCVATIIGAGAKPLLTIDPTEIVEARWFDRAEAASMLDKSHPDGLWVPGGQAIAHHLIAAFVDGMEPMSS
jgi:NAD+ diphosphatase